MRSFTIPRAVAGGVAAAALLITPALAATPDQSVPTGQALTFQAPASPNGFYQTWTFNYPGDNSNITVDAELGGFDPSQAGGVGFNVSDAQHPGQVVEIANTQTDQKQNDPQGIEFNYSSGFAGPVNFQFYSLSRTPITVTLTQSGLVPAGGGLAVPVTLTVQGTPTTTPVTAPAPAASAPPAQGAPAPAGSTVAAGQPANFAVASKPGGSFKTITFNYPGDNSNITFDAELPNFDVTQQGAVGFNVFDSQHQTSPVEIATTLSNQRSNDPHGIEFNYSSGTAGTVIVQVFNYSPQSVDVTLTNSGLVTTNGAATPVSLLMA